MNSKEKTQEVMKCPAVSINLCCFNSEKYLEETLLSVFNQTYKDWELVIVNDGSTDATETMVQKYISEGWPIVYHSQANAGLANARNKALELSQGQYIAFLDHDDLWLPEKLSLQISLLETRPDIAVIYSNASVIDGYGNIIAERYDNNFKPRDGDIFEDLLTEGDFVNWQTVVIRRSVLDDVGGFQSYKITEDYDMLLRCSLNRTCFGMDCVLAQYRRHDQNYSGLRISNDNDNLRRSRVEEKLETLRIYQYWIENMPASHNRVLSHLRYKISELYYEIGKSYFLLGNKQDGKSFLKKAIFDSPHKRRNWILSIVMKLPGDKLYLPVIKALHSYKARFKYGIQ
jgi:glycosyltransferase involved in cell wall biosynthesis